MSLSPEQLAGIRLDAQRALARIHDPVLRKDIVGMGYMRGLEISPEGRLVLDLVLPTPAHPGIGELRAALEARLGRIQGLGGLELRFGFWVLGRVGPKPRTLGQVKNLIAVSESGSGTVAAGLTRALAACGPTVELRSAAGLDDVGPAALDYLIVDRPVLDLEGLARLAADTPYVGLVLACAPEEASLAAARETLKACKSRGIAVLGLVEQPSPPSARSGKPPGENGPVDKLSLREGLAFIGGIPEPPSAGDWDRAARQLAGRVLAINHEARAKWHRPDELLFADRDHLEIVWHDGHRSVYGFARLREACCCAQCRDEWSGRKLIQAGQVRPDVRVLSLEEVGNYAINFRYSDGHDSGIYGFQYLRGLCECGECGA